jgi:hypothetical protein
MGTLLVTEESDFRRCEEVIEKGMSTFVEVGQALARIRDGKLYRDTHGTFAAYVKNRWGYGRDWAYKLIEAAGVTENVYHGIQTRPSLPPILTPSERQARELAKAPPEKQAGIWSEVVEEHGEEVTAAKVAEAVARSAKAEPADDEPAEEPDAIEVTLSDPWWASVCRDLNAIRKGIDERLCDPLLEPHMRSWCGRVTAELRQIRSTIKNAAPAERCLRCRGIGCSRCLDTGLLCYGAAKAEAAS